MVTLFFFLLQGFLSGNRVTKVVNSQAPLPRSHSDGVLCVTLDNESSFCDPSFSLHNKNNIGPLSCYEEEINVCDMFGPGPGEQRLSYNKYNKDNKNDHTNSVVQLIPFTLKRWIFIFRKHVMPCCICRANISSTVAFHCAHSHMCGGPQGNIWGGPANLQKS